MKKFYLTVSICTLILGANAQIGTGLLNKAKSTIGKEKKSEPAKSNEASPASTNTPESKPSQQEISKPKAECIPYFKEGDAKYKKDDGLTNEAHRKNAGKVVFSKTKITKDAQNEATFTNIFGMNDFVYCRIYANASILNTPLYNGDDYSSYSTNYNNSYITHISVNGVELKEYLENSNNSGEYEVMTTWQCFVKTKDPAKDGRNDAYIKFLNEAEPGTYTFRVWVEATNGGPLKGCKPVAEGEFTVTKKAGEKMSLGQKFADKKPGMVNTTLEAGALKAINNYATNQGWKETFTKCKIISEDWYIVRNKYTGIIEGRNINVYVLGKWPDGHCTGVEFNVFQQYDGSKYSSVFTYNGIGDTDKIDCE